MTGNGHSGTRLEPGSPMLRRPGWASVTAGPAGIPEGIRRGYLGTDRRVGPEEVA